MKAILSDGGDLRLERRRDPRFLLCTPSEIDRWGPLSSWP